MGSNGGGAPGAARLHLVDGISLLRPDVQVFAAMLSGFANSSAGSGADAVQRGREVESVGEIQRTWAISPIYTCPARRRQGRAESMWGGIRHAESRRDHCRRWLHVRVDRFTGAADPAVAAAYPGQARK